jgi:nicotinamidase/pyrazinamidase
MRSGIKAEDTDALIVVDVQNDFISGSMAIPDSKSIIPVINRLAEKFAHVIIAKDWHPPGHISFASAHRGHKHDDTVAVPYGPQRVFNDHCVQGTHGAELHPGLELTKAELVLRKGYRKDVDSFSAFFENDQKTVTGLAGYLHARGIRRVFCAGVALFGCVKATAEGALRERFEAHIVEDASKGRATTDGSNERAVEELRHLGVGIITSERISL